MPGAINYRVISVDLATIRSAPGEPIIPEGVTYGGVTVLQLPLGAIVSLRFGDQNGGRSFYAQFVQAYEIAPRFRLKLDMESLDIDYPDAPTDRARQLIFTLNYEIDPERAIGGRLILNRLEFGGEVETTRNFYLTYLQRVRRGFDLYIIYGLPNASRTQNRLAVKLITPLEL